MHPILADIFKPTGEANHDHFLHAGLEISLDLMVHFWFPVARRKDFYDELWGLEDGVSWELIPSCLRYPDHIGYANTCGGGEDRDFLDGFFPELLAQLTDQALTNTLMRRFHSWTQDEFSIFGQFIVIGGLLVLGELGPPLG